MKRTSQTLIGVVVALALLLAVWAALRPAPAATGSPGGTASAGPNPGPARTAGHASTSGKTTAPSKGVPASQATDPVSRLRWVSLDALPAEAADTLASIKAGPPYPYPRNDGVVYHNNNRVLPAKPDGYYHEFTVKTPGASNRGARRIIAGGPNSGQANAEYYYTADHYDSFERIRP